MACFAEDLLEVIEDVIGKPALGGKASERSKLEKLKRKFEQLRDANKKDSLVGTTQKESFELGSEMYVKFSKYMIKAVKGSKRVNPVLEIDRAIAHITSLEKGNPQTEANSIAVARNSTIVYADFEGLIKNPAKMEELSKALSLTLEETYSKVSENYLGPYAKRWMTLTKVHEHIHVGAVEFMSNNPDDAKTKYVNNLYKKLLKEARTDKELDTIQNGYWKVNVDEFLAVALSNPEMMHYLDGITVQNKSLLSKLAEVLLEMIGLDNNTELANLINSFDGMLGNKVDYTNKIREDSRFDDIPPWVTEEIPAEKSEATKDEISTNTIKKVPEVVTTSETEHELAPGVMATEGQNRAINSIGAWLAEEGSGTYLLAGRGGTGKTTVIKKVLESVGVPVEEIIFASPTHAATKVLEGANKGSDYEKAGYFTVAKLVGNKPMTGLDGEPMYTAEGQLKFGMPTEIDAKPDGSVLVIDEASMLDTKSYNALLRNYGDRKIIFMGDVAQLPPIEKGKQEAAVFEQHTVLDETFNELTEVKRQDADSTIGAVNDVVYQLVRDTVDDRRNGKPYTALIKFMEEYASPTAVGTVDKLSTALLNMTAEKINNGSVNDTLLKNIRDGDVEELVAADMRKNPLGTKYLMYNRISARNGKTLLNGNNENMGVAIDIRNKYLPDDSPGFKKDDIVVFDELKWLHKKGAKQLKVENGVIDSMPTIEDEAVEVVKSTTGIVVGVSKAMDLRASAMTDNGLVTGKSFIGKYNLVDVKLEDGTIVSVPMHAEAVPGRISPEDILSDNHTRVQGKTDPQELAKSSENFAVAVGSAQMHFGYANNVHKAQGITADSVYVNVENTLMAAGFRNDPDPETALKAFYVAISRPRKKLVLVHNKPIKATPPVTNTVKNLCKGN